MKSVIFSIIMPTYNSEKTLEESLKSIFNQTISNEKVEVLIVDGGSTDQTLDIAEKYACRIIKNERRLPEFAKQLGMMEAQGKYGIFLDSDERFENSKSLENRLSCMERFPEVKNVVSTGQSFPKNSKGVVRYANYIGDPFSNFVYCYNGYNRIEDLIKQYKCQDIENAFLMSFSKKDIIPLFDALGNMFEIKTARELYERGGQNSSFAANIFSNMVMQTEKAIVMKEDVIIHDCGLTRRSYLNKIKWRIKNNLFQTEGVGFTERSKTNKKLQIRKMLFVPYAFFLIPPIIQSLYLSVKNKDRYFMYHFLYTEYTFWIIVFYVIAKVLHIRVKSEKSYGKK